MSLNTDEVNVEFFVLYLPEKDKYLDDKFFWSAEDPLDAFKLSGPDLEEFAHDLNLSNFKVIKVKASYSIISESDLAVSLEETSDRRKKSSLYSSKERKNYMFKNPRFFTRGVQKEIPVKLQFIIWGIIDDLRKRDDFQLDYLQVFNLEIAGENTQKIIHHQEVPEYREEYIIPDIERPIKAKVFVIDSQSDIEEESYTTMLLASEY